MTHSERIAQLEQQIVELQTLRARFVNPLTGELMVLTGLSDDGLVPYLQFNARVGICTNFWMKKPIGQGAGFSVGAEDRFAVYAEVDTDTCRDAPSVAVFASVVGRPINTQPHIAFLGAAANARENHGLFLSFSNDKAVSIREEGWELRGYVQYFMGKIDGAIKKLWP